MKSELIAKLSVNIQNILTEELECYHCLIELSERQKRFIHLRDTDALRSILAQKEALIVNISRLENAIQRIFHQFPQLIEWMPASVKLLINRITAVLERLTALEKESESRLVAKHNAMKQELGNLKQSKTIIKTYTPQRTYRPRFIDRET